MTAEIEVETVWTDDSGVHRGSWRNIPRLPNRIPRIPTEESRVVSLLDHDVRNGRSVVGGEHQTRCSNSLHLLSQHLNSIRNTKLIGHITGHNNCVMENFMRVHDSIKQRFCLLLRHQIFLISAWLGGLRSPASLAPSLRPIRLARSPSQPTRPTGLNWIQTNLTTSAVDQTA